MTGPALAADAAVRAATEALASVGLEAGVQAGAGHENGRLVVTVTGADSGQVQAALAGSPSPSAACRRQPRAIAHAQRESEPPP